ncbi:MAG: hypothetical protein PHU54_09000 [Candidatus Omnitrophica bacterium]|jgi:hypothetical protein|nr:hypothetical protein [Candidatus Omnitrophota bacterium]
MTHYEAGRRFEYAVMHDLKERGYYCVRAAGSHSKIDVFAVKGDIALLIQCKANGVITPTEWDTLFDLCRAPNFLPIVASKDGGKPAYRLITARRGKRRREWQVFDPGESSC